jgi:hypothetical protein
MDTPSLIRRSEGSPVMLKRSSQTGVLSQRKDASVNRKGRNYTYFLLLFLTAVVLLIFYYVHISHLTQEDTSFTKKIPPAKGVWPSFTTSSSSTAPTSGTTIKTETEETDLAVVYSDIHEDQAEETELEVVYADLHEEGEQQRKKQEKIDNSDQKKQSKQQSQKQKSKPLQPPPMSNRERMQRNANKQKKLKFAGNELYNYQSDWGFQGKEKFIEVLPTNKIPLKKDRKVVFPQLNIAKPIRPAGVPSNLVGSPRSLLKATEILQQNQLYLNETLYSGVLALDEVMYFLQKQSVCRRKPIFLSMATVGDDLYWQLIENFVYSMVKFDLSSCSIVICVSDQKCMDACRSASFPCYNYQDHNTPLPSVMEQIAKVKLFFVPVALTRGVDVFMLDLDVGFLGDPKIMVEAFVETPIVDILVQEDYIFIMNRTKAGWKTWFTEPLPNIGLFLCRGNNRTARVFEIAWLKYLQMDDPWEKAQPGKDQNHVLDAMRIGRGTFGLKYAYFTNETAPLMDKLVLNYGNVMELGGELMESFLVNHHSLALHTTCYEKSTKVMGLKAGNAFWNPRYYDPLTRTITKQLIFINEAQLLDEVRSLVWLALVTERSLIVPNILGPSTPELLSRIKPYRGQVLWPGFRVTFLKRTNGRNELKVKILEPAFYWRVARDYDEVPTPAVLFFDPEGSEEENDLGGILSRLKSQADVPRVIIHSSVKNQKKEKEKELIEELTTWADDSIGLFSRPYETVRTTYKTIPSLKRIKTNRPLPMIREVMNGMRLCNDVFDPPRGNRSCFQICK